MSIDNILRKVKLSLRQMLCTHEWQQVGELYVEPDPQNRAHEIYYCQLHCVKCGKVIHEIFRTADGIR